MAIDWSDEDRASVDALIARHPADSGECETLARALLPVARRSDVRACALELRPAHAAARFVLPRKPLRRQWYKHVLTETRAHALDALTGPEGTPRDDYLETHFQYADALRLAATELEPVDESGQEGDPS
jgi:hypothetical protein